MTTTTPDRITVTKDNGGGFDEWHTVRLDGECIGRVCRQVMATKWLAYSQPAGPYDCRYSKALHTPRDPFASKDAAVAAILADHDL